MCLIYSLLKRTFARPVWLAVGETRAEDSPFFGVASMALSYVPQRNTSTHDTHLLPGYLSGTYTRHRSTIFQPAYKTTVRATHCYARIPKFVRFDTSEP